MTRHGTIGPVIVFSSFKAFFKLISCEIGKMTFSQKWNFSRNYGTKLETVRDTLELIEVSPRPLLENILESGDYETFQEPEYQDSMEDSPELKKYDPRLFIPDQYLTALYEVKHSDEDLRGFFSFYLHRPMRLNILTRI